MAIYLSDATKHTLNKFIFKSKDVKSNFMSDEIVNVIDSSSCDSSGDELDKGYLKYSPSTILQEKMSIVGKSSNKSGTQSGFFGDGETLWDPVNVNIQNKSLSEKGTRRISQLVKPVSCNVINKAVSPLESLNIPLKKHFQKNCPTKGLETSKLIKNDKANRCQLNLKKIKLPTLMKHSAFDVRRTNLSKLKNTPQSSCSSKNSRTKLKRSRQMLCNTKDNRSQCRSTNLTRKRSIDHSLADSEISLHGSNQEKIRKMACSNSSNCKSLNKQIKKHIDKDIQNNCLSLNVGKPEWETYPKNSLDDPFSLASVHHMSLNLPEIEPVSKKNISSSNHLNLLKQKTTSVGGESTYHNLLNGYRHSNNLEAKNEANFKTNTPIRDIKKTVSFAHPSPSVNVDRHLNKINRAIYTKKQSYTLKEKRKLPNKPVINPAQSFIKCVENRRILQNKEEFIQPVHLRFLKPKNTDLCKMRRLYEPSVAGYNCYRSDFAVEYDNEAEQVLSVAGHLNDLRLYPKIDEEGGRLYDDNKSEFHDDDLLEDLEIAIIEGYNSRLHERERRKKIIKEFGFINQKAMLIWQNKFQASLGKDEFKKLARFIQFQTYAEAGIIFASLELVYEKRAAINKLLFYRSQRGISSHMDISIFESLRLKFQPKIQRTDISNISYAPSSIEVCPKPRKKKSDVELFGMPRYRDLSNIEAELCTATRLTPEFFLDAKATLIADCKKNNGILLKKARKLFRKDVNKTRKIFNLLLEQGLIWLPEIVKN